MAQVEEINNTEINSTGNLMKLGKTSETLGN